MLLWLNLFGTLPEERWRRHHHKPGHPTGVRCQMRMRAASSSLSWSPEDASPPASALLPSCQKRFISPAKGRMSSDNSLGHSKAVARVVIFFPFFFFCAWNYAQKRGGAKGTLEQRVFQQAVLPQAQINEMIHQTPSQFTSHYRT